MTAAAVATRRAPTAGRNLGTYTNSIHAGGAAGTNSGARRQADRYRLQRIAQGLLWQSGVEWRDQRRTCWCSRSFRNDSAVVGVAKRADGSGASLTGLLQCGEVWTCPVCAAKIAEHRRAELAKMMATHVAAGGAAYLITLTFPHVADLLLEESLPMLLKARASLQNSRTWKRTMKDANRLGTAAALEFTVSQENGWHPHVHMLVFADRRGLGDADPINEAGDLDSEAIRELRREWINRLLKLGLADASDITNMQAHAFNVRGGDKAAEYIAKFGRDERWGASSEMTRTLAKAGAAGERQGRQHFTPFQLLDWAGQGDAWSACRFREYASAVKGRRALTFSPGLRRALLGVEEDLTDEQIAEQQPPDLEHVGELKLEQFQAISRRARLPDFLRYVAESATCQRDLDEYVDALQALPATHSAAVIVRGAFAGRHMIN